MDCNLYGFKKWKLHASQNLIIFRSLSKSVESPIFSLVHLDLSENHLHVIHPYVLSGFPSLKSLNLSNNGLHTVSTSALSLPSLETFGKLLWFKDKIPFFNFFFHFSLLQICLGMLYLSLESIYLKPLQSCPRSIWHPTVYLDWTMARLGIWPALVY